MTAFKIAFSGIVAVLVAIHCGSLACQSAKSTTTREQPTLDFFPKSKTSGETTLIWLKSRSKNNYLDWYNNIMESLKIYYAPVSKTSYQKICTYTDWPNEKEVCEVYPNSWYKCNRESYFSYHRNSPCIFLKLDNVDGWTPDMYYDPENLPANMPDSLKKHIGKIFDPLERKNIWISCEGETPADKENLGPVEYYPEIQGFPGFYFPYRNAEGYLSPLVAIKLTRPSSGIVISIECRAWAKNIKYDKADGLGYVQLELLIQ